MGEVAATAGGLAPEFLPESVASGGWATVLVVLFLFSWQLLRALVPAARLKAVKSVKAPSAPAPAPSSQNGAPGTLLGRVGGLVSDADLVDLIRDLGGREDDDGADAPPPWEDVIEKTNGRVSYSAKCCRPKNGPMKYLSTTTFESCNTDLLRDFYMDNEYRKKWDKTVIAHEQLEVDEIHAVEVGRTIKKFPLLTPREYVLAWRLWEGRDKTFYCFIKDCEHPLVPQQKKFVRVGYFRSGWRISKVPGRDACQIRMVHQEDAGLNVDMARLAFAKGIWSYVCKMDNALREYPSWVPARSNTATLVPLKIIQVPPQLENDTADETTPAPQTADSSTTIPAITMQENRTRSPTKAWIAKSLVVVGGVICLSRGNATLVTQLAMACFLKKLTKQGGDNDRDPAQEAIRSRWPSQKIGWSKRSRSVNHTSPKSGSSPRAPFAL